MGYGSDPHGFQEDSTVWVRGPVHIPPDVDSPYEARQWNPPNPVRPDFIVASAQSKDTPTLDGTSKKDMKNLHLRACVAGRRKSHSCLP